MHKLTKMKKPEIIPTVSLIIFTIVIIAITYNWQSVIDGIATSEPFAKVFSIFALVGFACGFIASVYFFVKSVLKGGNDAN